MLIDLHAHSSGISRCCRIPAPEVLAQARETGLDGIVLTNHYEKNYVTDGDAAAFARRYVEEYRHARACGEQMGMKVFFGIEVNMAQLPGVHMLVYGVGEEFVSLHPTIYDYSQAELYRAVKAAGGALVQGHPFRGGERLQDVKLLDGVEVNCHPLYGDTHSGRILDIAAQNGLIVTCGGDYHADTYRPDCGTYLPDDTTDGIAIGRFLLSTDAITLHIQEINAPKAHDHTFRRTEK